MGHPAHFHLFKNLLTNPDYHFIIVISDKDILKDLLEQNNISYIKISDYGSKFSFFHKFFKLILSTKKLISIAKKHQPILFIGCLSQMAWAGKYLNIKTFFFAEDDFEYTKIQGKITYPFVDKIITAEGVNVGPFKAKQFTYPAYQKLAYLHPDWFTPSEKADLQQKYLLKDAYFILRLVQLSAHHDDKISGISDHELQKIISVLSQYGQILISSEAKLAEKWKSFEFRPEINDMHSLMFHAKGVISDSQSMTVEAALLGTPNIRINDFKGKISILNELEEKFSLTSSYFPEEISSSQLEAFCKEDLQTWKMKRDKLLMEKQNPIPIYTHLIDSYFA